MHVKSLSLEAFFFNPKCTRPKYRSAASLCPDPLEELTVLTIPLAGLRALFLTGCEGKGEEERGGEKRKG